MNRVHGTLGNDTLATTAGGIFTGDGDDVLNITAQRYKGQIHSFAGNGDDLTNLMFEGIVSFSHGHHVRGELGADTFSFENIDEVVSVVVGRIEDFNPSEDRIQIEGVTVDFADLPGNVRVVSYNGAHDAGADPQQWMLIAIGPGTIFYALEGARVDMDGDGLANGGRQEAHFLPSIPDFAAMPDVAFIDQKNYVPAGFVPDGGVLMNDDDRDRHDVLEVMRGTDAGDLMAAGLNDDTVQADCGDDRVWGGSGRDSLDGGSGRDTIEGGTGADTVRGGQDDDHLFGNFGADLLVGNSGDDSMSGGDGDDRIWGGGGADVMEGGNDDDMLSGGSGDDHLRGEQGDDRLRGDDGNDWLAGHGGDDYLNGGDGNDHVYAGTGNDELRGEAGDDVLGGRAGDDLLSGGAGRDVVSGGAGSDRFEFRSGDMISSTDLNGTTEEGFLTFDLIEDFTLGEDRIVFRDVATVDDRLDLMVSSLHRDGDLHYVVRVRATYERVIVNVDDDVTMMEFFDDANFEFL